MKNKELFEYSNKKGIDNKLCSYLLKHHIHVKENDALTLLQTLKFKTAIKNLLNKPIQYIIGNVDFYGYNYKINKNTLIPRFETEQLVEQTIKYIKQKYKNKNIEILDLCTGSGCIGITLKQEIPFSNVTITDISSKALKIARKNTRDLNIKVIKSDLLKELIKKNIKYDVIISNPPYISEDDEIDDVVKNNEPSIALFAKSKGLYYYIKILKDIKKVLKEEFIIAFEIGCNQKEEIIKMANKQLKNIEIITKKDLQGRDRMMFIFDKKA